VVEGANETKRKNDNMNTVKQIIEGEAFEILLEATEHLGPFYANRKIDRVYRTLRLLGIDSEEAQKLISMEIERRQRISSPRIP